jgi:hypothetical protein
MYFNISYIFQRLRFYVLNRIGKRFKFDTLKGGGCSSSDGKLEIGRVIWGYYFGVIGRALSMNQQYSGLKVKNYRSSGMVRACPLM